MASVGWDRSEPLVKLVWVASHRNDAHGLPRKARPLTRIPDEIRKHGFWSGLRHLVGATIARTVADSREPFRIKELDLAGSGFRRDEADLDRLLALELRAHRARITTRRED